MNFPDNFSTQITEVIIKVLSPLNDNAIIKLDTSDYNKVFSHIYKTLNDTGLDEKMAANYNAVESYKKRMRDKYQHGVDALEEMFPNGMFTKDAYGELVGIDVMMKGTIRELLELESSKKETPGVEKK